MLATVLIGSPAQAATTVIHPNSPTPKVWEVSNFDGSSNSPSPTAAGTHGTFANGPDSPPAGAGSFRQVAKAGEKTNLQTMVANGTALSDLVVSYSTYRAAPATGSQLPAINLSVDTDGNGTSDRTLVYEPYQQGGPAPATGEWQSWDAAAGKWWTPAISSGAGSQDSPQPLSFFESEDPGAAIATLGYNLKVVSGSTGGWPDFDGNVDAITIGDTLYDFETFAVPVDCDATTNDVAAVQAAIDAAPDGATVTLKGTCDFRDVGAHGGTITSIARTAVLVRPGTPVNGLTITSDGAPQSATILGSGTQAAFTVAPGNDNVTITGLRFVNFGRAVVALNTTGTTVGSPGAVPSPDANRIVGGATMDSAILGLAVAQNPASAPTGTVNIAYGTGSATASFTGQASAVLSDFAAVGNYISFNPPGVPNGTTDIVAVDVRQRFGNVVDGVTIARNAVGMFASEFPHFNANAIKVHSTTPIGSVGTEPALTDYFIRDVTIQGNNLGRLEEVAPVADIHAAGRAGIVLLGVGDFDVSGNGVRTRMSTTAIPMPGGGIVASDSAFGRIKGNAVVVVHDPSTESSDLGAIGVVDDLNVLFGETPKAQHTGQVRVLDNIVGTVDTDTPGLGGQRGLLFNGATHVSATGNNVKHSSADAVNLGTSITGPGSPSNIGPKTLQKAVTEAVVCGNVLDGTADAPGEVDVSSNSTGNAFPGGTSSTNTGCALTLTVTPTLVGDGADVTLTGRSWPGRTLELELGDGTDSLTRTVPLSAANGAYTETFTAAELTALAEGALTATATVTDDLIPTLTATRSVSITKDTVDPAVTIDVVTDPINSGNVAAVLASGTVDAGSTVTLTVTDSLTGEIGPINATVTGSDWSVSGLDLGSFADGAIEFTAHAADAANNTSSATRTATKSTQGPAIDIASVTDPINAAVASSVAADGTGEPGLDVDVTFSDGQGSTAPATTTVLPDGTWSVSAIDASALNDGEVTVTAVSEDGSGNVSTATRETIKDTVAAVDIVSFPQTVNGSTASAVGVSGTTEAGSSVSLVATDGSSSVGPVAADVTSGDWTATLDLTSLADGTIDVTATATDGAGNTATDSVQIVKDVNAPDLSLDSLTDPITAANVDSVSASGTGEPGMTVKVTLVSGSGSIGPVDALVGPTGEWSLSGLDVSTLSDGTVTATAVVTNENDNSTTVTRDALKDTVTSVDITSAPTLVNASTASAVPVAGTAEPGVDVVVGATDGTASITPAALVADANGDWSATLDLSSLTDGDVTVTAAATDGVGNTATDSVLVAKDVVAPAVDFTHVTDPITSDNERTISAVGTGEPGTTVTVLVGDGTGTAGPAQAVVAPDGTWSVGPIDGINLLEGAVTYTATASDEAGNVTTAIRNAMKVGAQSGVIEILGSYFGYVSPEHIVNDRVRVKVRQPGPDAEATAVTVTDGTSTLSAGTSTLAAGAEHIFTVLAADLADGTITATAIIDGKTYQHSMVLDRGAPIVEIDSPGMLYVSTPVFSNTVFTGTATDATSPIESVIVVLRQGSSTWQTWAKRTTYANQTTWSATFNHLFLSPGEYSLTAHAVDAAGNTGQAVNSETFRVL